MAWAFAAMVLAVGGEVDAAQARVAVYSGHGAMLVNGDLLPNLLLDGDIAAETLSASDIRAGRLQGFDVVIFDAGFSSDQSAALGQDGRDAVRRFVAAGGGYVGICAGAYLALAGRDTPRTDRLELMAAASVDPWRRGEGEVGIIPVGGSGPPCTLDYENGPLVQLVRRRDLPAPVVLALYGEPEGALARSRLAGTPAVLAARYGIGRVLLFSPHPDRRMCRSWMLRQGVRWASGRGVKSTEAPAWATILPPERLTLPVASLPRPMIDLLRSTRWYAQLRALRESRPPPPSPPSADRH
jgi:hypothetical protein